MRLHLERDHRLVLSIALSFGLWACTTAAHESEDDSSTSDSTSDSTTDSTADSTTDSTDGGDPDACGCADGQLCVGTCSMPAGIQTPPTIVDARCIDAAACSEGADSLACRVAACTEASFVPVSSCGSADTSPYDLICPSSPTDASCDMFAQDCPDAVKCVLQLPDDELDKNTKCVEVTGADLAGDPCSSDGASTSAGGDSCEVSSMCWNGAPASQPFAGTCREFCAGTPEDPICPDGSTCTEIYESTFWHSAWLCL